MKLLIVSGLSGSGKSIALKALEGCGYYCVDDLPAESLDAFLSQFFLFKKKCNLKTAISVDLNFKNNNAINFDKKLANIRKLGINCEIIYLQTEEGVLLQRYNKMPQHCPLNAASIENILLEKKTLYPLFASADVLIDTSKMHCHQLVELIKNQLDKHALSLQFQSFGFKYGMPLDANFVFDVRTLPNPYWKTKLRKLNGNDQKIINFLQNKKTVNELFTDISEFITHSLIHFKTKNLSYLIVAIGCTGGQHRSVYLVNRLANYFQQNKNINITIRHRELY